MAYTEAGKFNTRIALKHDTEANWVKAKNFIPLEGEIIIYDADENYSYLRIKIGDGTTKVKDLPFDNIQGDWNQSDATAPDYIKNKTHGEYFKKEITYTLLEDAEAIYDGPPCGYIETDFYRDANEADLQYCGIIIAFDNGNEIETELFYDPDSNWHIAGYTDIPTDEYGDYLWTDYSYGINVSCRADEESLDEDGVAQRYHYNISIMFNGEYYDWPNSAKIKLYNTTKIIRKLDKKFLPADNAYISDIQEYQAKADWNINDLSDAGYIYNRTHYELKAGEVDLVASIQDQEFNLIDLAQEDLPYFKTDFAIRLPIEKTLHYGDIIKYSIKGYYDEVYYENLTRDGLFVNEDLCAATNDGENIVWLNQADNSIYAKCPGDIGHGDPTGEGIWTWPDTVRISFQLINTLEEDVVKQLDEKFIPDTIARKSDIAEQVQADWNQNDETKSDYIKNRTHYETVGYADIYSIQGMSSYINKDSENHNGATVYQLSLDDYPLYDSVPGTKIKVTVNAQVGSTDIKTNFECTINDSYTAGNPALYSIYEDDNGERGAFYSDGKDSYLYIIHDTDYEYSYENCNLDIQIQAQTDIVVQLDEKYIPDSIAKKSDVLLIDNKLSDKVDKISGKGLSTNDYTNEDKEKLNSVQYGAEKNVQPDWQQIDETSPDFIKNKTHYEVNISDKESIYTTERQGFSLTGENYNGFSVYRIEVSQGISIFDRYPVGTLFKLVVDSSETVIFEGTKHTDTSAMGNPYLYGGETDTGENCYVYSDGRDCVICVASNETMPAGSLNLKIVYTVSELKQLDEKYIPDTIARTEDVISLPPYTSADEGKILQIVNGVPTWVSLPNAEEATF